MKYLVYYDLQHQFYRVGTPLTVDNKICKPIMITEDATIANLTKIELNKKEPSN